MITSLAFGIVFALVLGGLSLVTPTIESSRCDGQNRWSNAEYTIAGVLSFSVGDKNCSATTKTQIGFPFASREKKVDSSIAQVGVEPNYTTRLRFFGLLANFAIYTFIGFLFFFIFSPNKKTMEMRKFSKGH